MQRLLLGELRALWRAHCSIRLAAVVARGRQGTRPGLVFLTGGSVIPRRRFIGSVAGYQRFNIGFRVSVAVHVSLSADTEFTECSPLGVSQEMRVKVKHKMTSAALVIAA